MANARETSLVLVKQDGVQRGLVGQVISRFENRGFKIVGLKFVQVSLPSSLMIILFKTIYLIFFFSLLRLYLNPIMKNIKVNSI